MVKLLEEMVLQELRPVDGGIAHSIRPVTVL